MTDYWNIHETIYYRHKIFLKYYSTCVPTLHIVCRRRIQITTFRGYLPPSAVRAWKWKHCPLLSPRWCFVATRNGECKVQSYVSTRIPWKIKEILFLMQCWKKRLQCKSFRKICSEIKLTYCSCYLGFILRVRIVICGRFWSGFEKNTWCNCH